MKINGIGCLIMALMTPVVLAFIAGVWWIVGFCIINCVNYLAQSQALPTTSLAYICAGFLFALITGGFKVTFKDGK